MIVTLQPLSRKAPEHEAHGTAFLTICNKLLQLAVRQQCKFSWSPIELATRSLSSTRTERSQRLTSDWPLIGHPLPTGSRDAHHTPTPAWPTASLSNHHQPASLQDHHTRARDRARGWYRTGFGMGRKPHATVDSRWCGTSHTRTHTSWETFFVLDSRPPARDEPTGKLIPYKGHAMT